MKHETMPHNKEDERPMDFADLLVLSIVAVISAVFILVAAFICKAF